MTDAPNTVSDPTADARFARALDHVFRWEGGFSDDPADPGGATRFGITRATLADWRGEAVSVADVRALGRDEAAAIYRARYWDACRCAEMPPGLDLLLFDAAVNQGAGRAVRILQAALRVRQDGEVGPVTQNAARSADPRAVIVEFAARRMQAYGMLATFPRFGLGWSRRLMDGVAAALAMR